ncbi:MAG: SdpI family protein [Armatimonadota bacterium]
MTTPAKMPLRAGLIWSSLLLGVMVVLSAIAWVKVPAGQQIPIHWGVDGQPDNYAGKTFALLMMPMVGLAMALLLIFIARIEPRQGNITRSAKAFTIIWISTLAVLTIMHAFLVATALGIPIGINTIIPVTIGLLFIIMGNYLGKIRSNFFLGIRTPWTLSSELSWSHTHRLGGKLFMLIGAILLLSMLLNDMSLVFYLLMAELLGATLLLSIYSYLVWRMDPNKKDVNGQPGELLPAPATTPALRILTIISVLYVLALPVAAVIGAQWATPRADVTQRAREMVQAMAQGDFQQAETNFDPRMRAALPPDRLRGIWSDLTTQYGPFQRITGTRISRLWPYTQVYVTMQFARSPVTVRVVCNRSGEISGLWLASR